MHLLITSDTVGGVWTYTQELVTGLIQRGHSVTLVSFGGLPAPHQTEWMRGLFGLDYRPTEYALEWMETAERDVEESRRYLELLVSEVKPDVLHLSQYGYGNLKVNIPKVVVAHSDLVSWWVAVHGTEPEDSPWIRRYRQTVCDGLEGADLVVAPSRWMLDSLARNYGCPQSGSVVYNGRTPSLFDPSSRKTDFILSVGRLWDGGKNVSLLLQKELELPVRIAGWQREPGRENPTRTTTIPSNAQLLGPRSQSELRELFASAAIYVGTSRYEPFGLAPLEAALSRCALVLNDNPVFHELWDGAAIFFKRDDPDDLSRVISELTCHPEKGRECAESAYRRAVDSFAAELMIAKYESLYKSVSATAEVG